MPGSTSSRLRKFWFQVHLWLGVALVVVLIPISATGSYEVWHEEIDRLINGRRYATSDGPARPPSRYLEAAQTAFGARATVNGLRMPARESDPVIVTGLIVPTAGRATAAPPPRRPPVLTAWVDPATARVLDVADTSKAFRQTIHRIHGSLLIPEVGRKVVGWLGWALFVSAVSGLWLWWPRGRFVKAFRWRRTPSTLLNLHHLAGFWIALPLAVLALSGALISFPQTTRGALGIVVPVTPPAARGGGGGQALLAAPRIDADAATRLALDAAPDAEVRRIEWPTQGELPVWRIELARDDASVLVTVSDIDGAVSVTATPVARAGDAALRWNRRIHDGSDMGVVWRAVITLAGLMPALLGITGVIVWVRRQGRKAAF